MRVRYQTAPHPEISLMLIKFHKIIPKFQFRLTAKQSGYQTEFILSVAEGPHPEISLILIKFQKIKPKFKFRPTAKQSGYQTEFILSVAKGPHPEKGLQK